MTSDSNSFCFHISFGHAYNDVSQMFPNTIVFLKMYYLLLVLLHCCWVNMTAMHGAGFQGRAAIVKLLARHGLDPLDTHKDGYTGMHRACWGNEKRHAETVQAFIDAGVPHDYPSQKNDDKTCRGMTRNPDTIEVIKKAMAKEDEEKAEL